MSITNTIKDAIKAGLVRATTNPVTGRISLSGVNIRPRSAPLLTVVCGNSISTQGHYFQSDGTTLSDAATADSFFQNKAEVVYASMLSGAPIKFPNITKGTRTDGLGIYGYSGQTLATINADLVASFFTPITVQPDLVIGLALLENDIAGAVSPGVTNANIKTRLDTWIAAVKARWPGVMIMLCTPRPSFSNSAAAHIALFQYAVTYMKSLDDNSQVFVCDISNVYQDPAALAQPLAGYTDASVHPTPKGAIANARVMAQTLNRISPVPYLPWSNLSPNLPLNGSAAASGTGVSGTFPTSMATGNLAAGCTLVATALDPGVQLAYTVAANATQLDLTTINLGYVASATTSGKLAAYARVQIVSGGANIRAIELALRQSMDVGNDWRYGIKTATADTTEPVYADGDVLTILLPVTLPTSGRTITGVSPYLRFYGKLAGGSFTVIVTALGVGTPP